MGAGGSRATGVRAGLPLFAVLVVQALLSVRLLGADTAFVDEAAYLWAGHLEWAHWLHGAAVPPFSSYFSGAPVLYPPLGALADSVGGLTGARVLSLVFMLGATVLLWDVTGRLFGRQAGFFAAALFAVAGPTLHLGAFATYDAMSLFLLALAAWLVAGAAEQQEAAGRMAGAGVVLALANATAYSTALFDPVIVALALVIALPSGRRLAARRCGSLVTVLVALLIAAVLLGGSSYWQGITQTTLGRAAGAASPLRCSGRMVLDRRHHRPGRLRRGRQLDQPPLGRSDMAARDADCRRAARTAGAGPPAHPGRAEQACRPGRLVRRDRRRLRRGHVHRRRPRWPAPHADLRGLRHRPGLPRLPGHHPVTRIRHQLAQLGHLHRIFRPLATHGNGHLLVEDPSIAEYYLPSGSHWQRWSSTRNIVLPGGSNTGGPTQRQTSSEPATPPPSTATSPSTTSPSSP